MSKQDSTTWYVVADGSKARVLVGEGEHVRTIHSFDADGHGDVDESASAGPHQLKAPHTDPKQQSKTGFATVVASTGPSGPGTWTLSCSRRRRTCCTTFVRTWTR